MARTDNLTNFLTDVATAIKTKKGSQENLYPEDFDTEIESFVLLSGEQITINPSTSQQVVTPTQGHNGITQVTVPAVTSAIDANITQNNIKSGVTILGVQGNLEPDKPDQSKTVTPTTSQQIITPDTGYELASVTVNAVTSAIDPDIVAGNIKKDVNILGVVGSYEGTTINNQDKTVSPTTSQQAITADNGYTGLGQVTVNAVTSAIDANIVAGNIKKDVVILGVTGTYEGSGGGSMKEYASVALMNADIANISDGEVVKVTTNPPAYYIKDTGVMVLLVKETETLTPTEYNNAVDTTEDILGVE